MPKVDIPSSTDEKVREYADEHGLPLAQAYVELIEFALRNVEPDDDDGDPRSGIA